MNPGRATLPGRGFLKQTVTRDTGCYHGTQPDNDAAACRLERRDVRLSKARAMRDEENDDA